MTKDLAKNLDAERITKDGIITYVLPVRKQLIWPPSDSCNIFNGGEGFAQNPNGDIFRFGITTSIGDNNNSYAPTNDPFAGAIDNSGYGYDIGINISFTNTFKPSAPCNCPKTTKTKTKKKKKKKNSIGDIINDVFDSIKRFFGSSGPVQSIFTAKHCNCAVNKSLNQQNGAGSSVTTLSIPVNKNMFDVEEYAESVVNNTEKPINDCDCERVDKFKNKYEVAFLAIQDLNCKRKLAEPKWNFSKKGTYQSRSALKYKASYTVANNGGGTMYTVIPRGIKW